MKRFFYWKTNFSVKVISDVLQVCALGWERSRGGGEGGGGLGGAPWLLILTRAVERFGDLAGGMCVCVCVRARA